MFCKSHLPILPLPLPIIYDVERPRTTMKIGLPSILLLSIIALASGEVPGSSSESVTVDAQTAEAVSSDAPDGDAGKQCAAGDCTNPDAAAKGTTEAAAEPEPTKEEEDPSCPSRPHVIRCAAKYLDTNQNGKLERSELESVMNTVPWLLRGLLKIIGSIDTIMKKCDADGDGAIDIQVDMEATKETCLATCFKRNAFKKLFFPECTE